MPLEERKLVPTDYRILIKLFELVIKCSPKKVPVAHIRTNMTTAGMTRERYFALLDQVT